MREILFRGKRIDNGEWVEGCLAVIFSGESDEDEREYIADKKTGHHTPVILDTIRQYTGMKDKNCNRIFEGDIVKVAGDEAHYYVGWEENPMPGFTAQKEHYLLYFDSDWGHTVEIIGNILDNPELWGGKRGEVE